MTEPSPGLTSGAVARRLGVAPTTLRSWDRRYGIGPAAHESGRHRRWTPGDIAVLQEMCRLTASGVPPAEAARAARAARSGAAPAALPTGEASTAPPAREQPLGDVRRELRGLGRAAVRLDSGAMDELLESVIARHGLVAAWEEVLAPALHAVGRKWETSEDRYVEVEHLLSWHVSTALRRVGAAGRTGPPEAGTPPVLLACVPNEQHTLPLEALAAGLAELGVPTLMFGAAVPPEALDQAVRRTGPAAVVLWAQARSTAHHPLARHVADASWGVRGARTRTAVLLAGPGWAGRTPGPGMLRPVGLRDALSLLHGLCAAARDGDGTAAPSGGP
ncbi:cobalamin B12-binding domain-containing protein [Streptomyces sp. NBC_00250]|uniref:cobalamin B12-binding domain-containing protein n=1 Tax=Streptomyces sp. NBC_00250 TaxID=2903641 RepID=UPI002E28E2B6|nr:cobalamin B12-binding domain-containing protein [Streptomyces sp. NBC_00250]